MAQGSRGLTSKDPVAKLAHRRLTVLALAWRCADTLSLRAFLRLETAEAVPGHSWLSKTGPRRPLEVHEAVLT